MKKILFVLFVQLFTIGIYAQETTIKEAETAYTQKDYSKAIELYEKLLKQDGESAYIYYNLGNSYYKADKIAPAILNYERALLLDPGDSDIRFNLQMAKQKTVDKIEPLDDFFLTKWVSAIQNMGAVDSWAKIALISFLLFIGCLVLFFFSRQIRYRKLGFYAGLLLMLIVIFSNIFASNQKEDLLHRKSGIIFAPTVTIKSSPNESGNDLFILHEGTKVNIRSTLGDWSEISLEDGNVGWIPSDKIEII